MTWRRFLALLRGLSSQSATVVASSSRIEFGASGERVSAIAGEGATQTAFVALFGRGKAPA